ncbi:MAG TPA: hypothetical protein VIH90_04355 [Candidatus Saccharimonadales bacterium]
MTIGLTLAETLNGDALFDAFEQGIELDQEAQSLVSRASQGFASVTEGLRPYEHMYDVGDADYGKLSDLAIRAVHDEAKATEKREQLAELTETTRSQFAGRVALIRPLQNKSEVITAYTLAPGGLFQGRRIPLIRSIGILMRPHPEKAEGAIEDLSLPEGTLDVRPRRFSAYRTDNGFFRVHMLDDQDNRTVSIELSEPA